MSNIIGKISSFTDLKNPVETENSKEQKNQPIIFKQFEEPLNKEETVDDAKKYPNNDEIKSPRSKV